MITYLDATENGSVILQDATFTRGGKVLYEGKNMNHLVEKILQHGFDPDNCQCGSTMCESEEAQELFNTAVDICTEKHDIALQSMV